MTKNIFIRNIESESYRENLLVSAVVTVFVIRIFLKVSGYPQLGIGDLHIAHILWGGFFMIAAIIILLSFLNKDALRVSSVLGGIGFGTFIDEFGKVVTEDNDYFFQPTIAFIYIIFVLLYLIFHMIPRYRPISKKEYLVNAMEMMKESAINDFDKEEEQQAREYLAKADQKNKIVQALSKLLQTMETVPVTRPNIFIRLRHGLQKGYWKIAHSDLILHGVIIFLAFQTVRTFGNSISLFITRPDLLFDEWGKLISSLLVALFATIGFLTIKSSKVDAYKFFRIAVLVSLLLTDFFALMNFQWYEIFSILGNVFVLQVINYAQLQEKEKEEQYAFAH